VLKPFFFMPWPKGRPAHNRAGPDPESYVCNKCGIDKPLTAYHWKHNQRTCKECNKPTPEEQRAKTLKRYGITQKTYMQMLETQNFSCAICEGTSPKGAKRADVFVVDHDHETGQVRALLCHACNRGLGNFQDNETILHRAVAYKQKWTNHPE
jgi:hypothetical protein